jgi:quercetin dioxygenase-like cupin family protein
MMALVAVVALLALGLMPGIVAGHENSAGPTVVAEASFAVDDPPSAPLEAHQLVLEFAPGAVAVLHHHGGPGFITMLTGELSLVADGEEHTYRAGDDFIEVPVSLYEGTNLTDAPARLMVTYLVPSGHPVTTYANAGSTTQSTPPPQVVTQAVFEIAEPPVEYEVVHQLLDYAPGSWALAPENEGDTFITVVQGELVARDEAGAETVYAPGATRTEEQGVAVERGSTGGEVVRIVTTTLVPAVDETLWSRFGQIGTITMAACVGLVAGGFMLRRRRVT